jgi:hypothetical protein
MSTKSTKSAASSRKNIDLGYTRFYRSMWNNPVLMEKGKRYSRLEAWWYLVNFQARGIDGNGLNRGEFSASYRFLAGAWNWSIDSVYRFIKTLERDGMITRAERQPEREAERQPEHFIICNYETYNPPPNANPNGEPNANPNKVKESKNKEKEGEKESCPPKAADPRVLFEGANPGSSGEVPVKD